MPTQTNNPESFFVVLTGAGVNPRIVPTRTLTRILNAIQGLIDLKEYEPEEGEEDRQEASPLHLIRVRDGSAAYKLSTDSKEAIAALIQTGRWMSNPTAGNWDPAILRPAEELSAAARALNCIIELKRDYRDTGVIAKITPETYKDLSTVAFVRGESSLVGCLERVGGATEMKCSLRLPGQADKLVYCTVTTADLVCALGQHLYQNILVSGTVTWLRQNWRVRTIEVTAFEPPKEGTITEALKSIYDAGGKAWDKVEDPDSFIAEMRGS